MSVLRRSCLCRRMRKGLLHSGQESRPVLTQCGTSLQSLTTPHHFAESRLTQAAAALKGSNGTFSLTLGSKGGPTTQGGGKGSGGGGSTESGFGPGGMSPERLVWVLVHQGLGALVRLRGRPGHYGQEVVIAHSAIAEWLQVGGGVSGMRGRVWGAMECV